MNGQLSLNAPGISGVMTWIVLSLFVSMTSTAQSRSADSTEAASTLNLERAAARPPLRYLNLRYDENYLYLADSTTAYPPDFFDPIKYVALGSGVSLRAGGELRLRYESEINKFLAPGPQKADGFLLSRLALHADLQLRNVVRLYAEGIHADVYDRDEVLFFIHRNRLDLHQLFFDVNVALGAQTLALRVGRQELAYGNERLVSASGWGRIRKRFDAVKLLHRGRAWDVDAWYARPVITETTAPDHQDEDIDFGGLYISGKQAGVDLYYLYQRESTGVNPNGNTGSRTVHTLGTRHRGLAGAVDYELELMLQPFGVWAGDEVRAWSVGVQAGYTLRTHRLRPRLGVGVEVASGDEDPNDDRVGTFHQLYRQEKDHLGYLVLYGRQNVQAFNVNFRVGLIPRRVMLEVFHYWFALQRGRDAIYNPGGVPLGGRRDVSGMSGRRLGRELDLVLGWQVDAHHALLIGYIHYWSGAYIRSTGESKAPGDVFLQYQLLF